MIIQQRVTPTLSHRRRRILPHPIDFWTWPCDLPSPWSVGRHDRESAPSLGRGKPHVFLFGLLGASDLHHEKEEHTPGNHGSKECGKHGAGRGPTFTQSQNLSLTSQTAANPQIQE